MKKLPKKLQKKLQDRIASNAIRKLGDTSDLIDFSSNDYLGYSKNISINQRAIAILKEYKIVSNGATGSRLLSGNHTLYDIAERAIARFHESETALIFNSGYDANLGFFQSVPQRGDIIIYDELIHASIRDGISMSHAKSYKFKHNDLEDLKRILSTHTTTTDLYVVTESVFSMDGDTPYLIAIRDICTSYNARLIVDEAHAVGVLGSNGEGIIQHLGIKEDVFARIVTFGKAMGAHGAAILGSEDLREYLINFARSFIYTTGLPPHSLATIIASYEQLIDDQNNKNSAIAQLHQNIKIFTNEIKELELGATFIPSPSAIQCAIIPGNENVRTLSRKLIQKEFDVKPILPPTVPKGQERLRFCLHSYNNEDQIKELLVTLKKEWVTIDNS